MLFSNFVVALYGLSRREAEDRRILLISTSFMALGFFIDSLSVEENADFAGKYFQIVEHAKFADFAKAEAAIRKGYYVFCQSLVSKLNGLLRWMPTIEISNFCHRRRLVLEVGEILGTICIGRFGGRRPKHTCTDVGIRTLFFEGILRGRLAERFARTS